MRVAEPLTDKKIKTTQADKKPSMLFDGCGLYLEVTTAGSKIWRFKYKFDGKVNRISICCYPEMFLLDARAKRINCEDCFPSTLILMRNANA